MSKQKINLFSRILGYSFLLVNIGSIVWLLLCLAAAYTSPEMVKYLALFSLFTPVAIMANIFFVIFWLFTRKKIRSLGSLTALLLCYKLIVTVFGFNFFTRSDMSRRPGTIKVMTWNVHGMGIFNRPHDKEFDRELLNFIKIENADIICLPEFSAPKDNLLKPFAEKIIKNNDYIDYRFKDDNTLGTTIYLGTAVFSKYPFKNYVANKLAEYVYLLQGDMQLPGGQMIRMFFVHLNTFGLSDADKAYIQDIKNTNVPNNNRAHSRSFIWKFNYAFTKRARLADKARKIIAQSPYPVFVCGDFNDLPASYTYTTIRGDLKDAFLEMGSGFGRTYNQISPTLRIDHIFYDPAALKQVGIDNPYTSLSDHSPMIANFEIIPIAAN